MNKKISAHEDRSFFFQFLKRMRQTILMCTNSRNYQLNYKSLLQGTLLTFSNNFVLKNEMPPQKKRPYLCLASVCFL